MVGLLILFGIFFAVGLFLVLADVFRIPTMMTLKAMSDVGKEEKRKNRSMEMMLMDGAVLLGRHLPMNPHKKAKLAATLRAAGINKTPEAYTAYAYIKAAIVLIGVIPCVIVMPLVSIGVVMAALMVYFKEIGKADELMRAKREVIESELSRFASTIEQELKNSRDVLSILENYKKNAGEEFAKELDIVCADMRSSSYETALTRFEARLNSSQLSDIVRGLIGVLRGDDSAVCFQMLVHDFKQIEIQRLKAKAQKIPPKIRKYSFLMLMCFMITYLFIIGYEIIKSMGSMI
ncbi:MAG: secretion protein F [Butyrivibrio sp.]|nr:secretion protein F [Butyrivibrio sp.]